MANRTEGDVMRDHEPNRGFDLLRRSSHDRAISCRGSDRPVYDMVDLMVFECEHLGQPSANFVQKQHGLERLPAVQTALLRGGDRHRIKVVVAEFTASVSA